MSDLWAAASITRRLRRDRAASNQMRRLRARTRLAVALAVLDGSEIVYLHRLCVPHTAHGATPGQAPRGGSRSPAYCTAMGKLLIAYLPEPQRERLLDGLDFERCGGPSERNRRLFAGELSEIAADGLAINDEEDGVGVQAIAVPVRDQRGEALAALSVIGSYQTTPVAHLLQREQQPLRETAAHISGALGYKPTALDSGPRCSAERGRRGAAPQSGGA